jgi:integrating conjugative element protein (TIGR03758 family)
VPGECITKTTVQQATFQAYSGFTPSQIVVLALSLVLVVPLLFFLGGGRTIRTAYIGLAEQRLSNRQFVGIVIRFVTPYLLYLLLKFFLLS